MIFKKFSIYNFEKNFRFSKVCFLMTQYYLLILIIFFARNFENDIESLTNKL